MDVLGTGVFSSYIANYWSKFNNRATTSLSAKYILITPSQPGTWVIFKQKLPTAPLKDSSSWKDNFNEIRTKIIVGEMP